MIKAKDITDKMTMAFAIPILLFEAAIKKHISIDSEWITNNEILIILMILSIPSILVMIWILIGKNIIFDKRYLIKTEILFSVTYLSCALLHCDLVVTGIAWLVLSLLIIMTSYKSRSRIK